MIALLSDHGAPNKSLQNAFSMLPAYLTLKLLASEDLTAGLGPGKELKSASYIYQQ